MRDRRGIPEEEWKIDDWKVSTGKKKNNPIFSNNYDLVESETRMRKRTWRFIVSDGVL